MNCVNAAFLILIVAHNPARMFQAFIYAHCYLTTQSCATGECRYANYS